MAYRVSRNIEASLIQFIEDQLVGAWVGISVEKAFSRVYKIDLPVICIRCGTTSHDSTEIGGNSTVRTPNVLIDIFAEDDGQRLDLKDFLIEKLRGGCVYYDYTITNGQIISKTANGRIRVLNIDDTPIDFDVEKSKLDVHDRYRHLLSLSVSLGRVET